MTTIILARPKRKSPTPEWQVFGCYEGDDDRYTFAVRSFPADANRQAERYAHRLMANHHADRLERR